MQKELLLTYIVPFLLMSLSSYFSVHALANMMQTDLLSVNILSVGVIAIFFVVCYGLSVVIYCQNAVFMKKDSSISSRIFFIQNIKPYHTKFHSQVLIEIDQDS